MKVYWDTSAIVVCLHDKTKVGLLRKGENYTRPHTLAELFSTLTGGRCAIRYAPKHAAALAISLRPCFTFVELNANETLAALKGADGLNVHGGRVHDLMHAVAAAQCGAEQLFTYNGKHFDGLVNGIPVLEPTG